MPRVCGVRRPLLLDLRPGLRSLEIFELVDGRYARAARARGEWSPCRDARVSPSISKICGTIYRGWGVRRSDLPPRRHRGLRVLRSVFLL
jgi:hypothetical protein